MKCFEGESERAWQFQAIYENGAKPLAEAGEDANMNGAAYSVDVAWKQRRRRHAQECMTFIIAHQSACEKTAAAAANHSTL